MKHILVGNDHIEKKTSLGIFHFFYFDCIPFCEAQIVGAQVLRRAAAGLASDGVLCVKDNVYLTHVSLFCKTRKHTCTH